MLFETENPMRSSHNTTLNNSMCTQIVSMLKGIVLDQQEEEQLNEHFQMESLFNSADDDDKIQENNSTSDSSSKDTTSSPHSAYDTTKSQPTNYTTQLLSTIPSLYLNNTTNDDIERRSQKSLTNIANPATTHNIPMMPLHTFNFKNNYLKNGKDNTTSHQQINQHNTTNPNVVIPIMPVKPSSTKKNKHASPFEQKETYLNNLLLHHQTINWEIYNYIKGNFTTYIQNQQTSRLFQYYFDQTHPDITHLLFNEMYEQLNLLLLDPYANYFCLKIFYFLNANDRLLFLNKLALNFVTLSTNKISTYPIQCIIQSLTSPSEQSIIIKGLLYNNMHSESNIIKLSFDLYGTHVIEKILEHFNIELLIQVISLICNDFLFIANNPNGLCVVKKVIEVANNTMYFDIVNEQLTKNALLLIQNPYGNYTLQHAFDVWDISQCEGIIAQFQSNLVYLSIQKYSSNVIEKCLEKSNTFLLHFCKELVSDTSYSTLILFMKNTFGNFVIQTILNCVKNTFLQSIMVNAIMTALTQIQEKSIVMKWKKKLVNYNPSLNY